MKNMIRAIKLIFPIYPHRMVFYLLLSLPEAVLPAVLMYLQRRIIDQAAGAGRELSLTALMMPVLLMIGTYMAQKMFSLLSKQYMEFGYFQYVFMGLDARIHGKSAQISLEYYDNAEYYKIVQNAKRASMFLVFTANLAILSLVVICNLLSVGGYLAALHPLLILFVAFVSIPVILERVKGAKFQSNLMQDTAQAVRRKKYAFELLSKSGSKKELAHHGAGDCIASKYRAACREIDEKEGLHIRKTRRNGLLFAGVKTLFHGLSVFLMVWLLVTRRITIGGFSVLLTSFSALTGAFTQLFNHAGELLQTGVMSSAFFAFMDLEVKDGTKSLVIKEKDSGDLLEAGKKDNEKSLEGGQEIVRLEHVSYRYPSGADFALKDISFTVKKGEKIAIVGENGAGKTTLAKLLSGFLLPAEGTMKFSGIPRSQLKEDSIFRHISAVYQDFGRYKLTLAQNVYLGDIGLEMNMEGIRRALEWAGLSLSEDPEELALGREFGGTELSGGQWQRLALARSYYRQRPLLFLDEPTAAIDPLEEMALYGKLSELAEERTVVLITHRLGAVRNADKIIVLDGGSIAEMGSFAQLIEKKGRFHHIWQEQARWYQKG